MEGDTEPPPLDTGKGDLVRLVLEEDIPGRAGLTLNLTDLRGSIKVLVDFVHVLHKDVLTLRDEDQDIRDSVEVVQQSVVGYDARIRDAEEVASNALIQVRTTATEAKDRAKKMEEMAKQQAAAAEAAGVAVAEAQAMSPRGSEGGFGMSAQQLKEVQDSIAELDSRMKDNLAELATEASERHDQLKARVDSVWERQHKNFEEQADKMDRLRSDVDQLRQRRDEDFQRKADRKELEVLQKQMEKIDEFQKENMTKFESAMVDIGKAQQFVSSVTGMQEQLQDLWLFARKGLSDLREWSAQGFGEQKREVLRKADAREVRDDQDDLRNDVVELTKRLLTVEGAVATCSTKMVDKREILDLKDVTTRISQSITQREGVLFGQRCLSCNRTFADQAQTANAVELDKEKQRTALLHEVEQAYNSTDGGAVKFLSINVGRSGQQRGTDGALYNTQDTSADRNTGMVPISNLNLMAVGDQKTSPPTAAKKRIQNAASLGNQLGTLGRTPRHLIGSLGDPLHASKQRIAERQLSDLVNLTKSADTDLMGHPIRSADLALPAPPAADKHGSSSEVKRPGAAYKVSAPMTKLSSKLQTDYQSSFDGV